MLSVSPGIMVLMFQLAMQRAEVFFLFFGLAAVKYQPVIYKLHTPSGEGISWEYSIILAGGCPA